MHIKKYFFFFSCVLAGGVALTLVQPNAVSDSQNVTEYSQLAGWEQQKRYILADANQRIAPEFGVSSEFYQRVSFWFDVYTRYEGHHKIIHHNLYPWIVYEVVDTSKMANPDRYMSLKMKWYRLVFQQIQAKGRADSDEEKRLLERLAQATNPERALKTAHQKVRWQTGMRDTIALGLERSEPYLDHMEEIFAQEELPVELTRLPLVESSFDTTAYSRVGAVGVWQFMRRTGKKFMRVNGRLDERLSPLKSTMAAAKLLRQNRKILNGQWPLAVTAYNYGPSGLRRAVRKLASTDIEIIVEHHRDDRFSFASSNFYACFLAVLYAEKYRDYVFPSVQKNPAPAIATLQTEHKTRARDLLQTFSVDQHDFLVYNPDFRKALKKDYLIPKNTKYFLPLKTGSVALSDSDEDSAIKIVD